jgi:hypothetical protein
MKVFGIILIVIAVLGGLPAIRSIAATGGLGESSADPTRALTRL